MSDQCRWLHDWGKWEFLEYDANGITGETPETRGGGVTTQFRECKRCGYSQTKLDRVTA